MDDKLTQNENLKIIVKELKQTNRHLKKFVSLRKTFTRGIVHGLGAALGATIVLSVLISIIIWGFSQLKFIPLIGTFAAQIVEFVQNNRNPVEGKTIR